MFLSKAVDPDPDPPFAWYFYMVAQNKVRTYGVNQVFRIIEGIRLHRQIVKSDFFGKDLFYFIRPQHILSYHLI